VQEKLTHGKYFHPDSKGKQNRY